MLSLQSLHRSATAEINVMATDIGMDGLSKEDEEDLTEWHTNKWLA